MDTLFWVGFAASVPPGLWIGWQLGELVKSKLWGEPMSNNKLRPVTVDEQESMGLRRLQRPANYVPPMPARRAELPAMTSTTYQIDAQPSAQLGSITHTSAVDRAKGYTIIQAPLAAIMAVLVLAVAKSLADFPLLSFAAFLTFWVSFALVWLAGWGLTLLLSAEGVAFYEARRKWNVVEREQSERWGHYNRQYEGDDQ